MKSLLDPQATCVLQYWLADSADSPAAARKRHAFWYRAGVALDNEIRRRFGHLPGMAIDGRLRHWASSAHGSLALVIVLDQFTRHIFRGTPVAYSGDALALQIADQAIRRKQHRQMPAIGSVFLFHPFHHSELPEDQKRGVRLLIEGRNAADVQWKPYLQRCIDGFSKHCAIVERFGRFPHRNRVLGRECTPAETAFLQGGASTYGQ